MYSYVVVHALNDVYSIDSVATLNIRFAGHFEWPVLLTTGPKEPYKPCSCARVANLNAADVSWQA